MAPANPEQRVEVYSEDARPVSTARMTLELLLAQVAEQVWTFTRNLAVPWTNNASEQALKGPKRHQAVSGYWHTLSTLAAYLRGPRSSGQRTH